VISEAGRSWARFPHSGAIRCLQIFSSCQCMDRQSALDIGTTNKHSHPRANHTHPLSQPRFRGNAMLPQVRAVSEIDQCFKTSGQVSLYRWTSAAISFSQRPCLILSKQYRKSINACRFFGRCRRIDRHPPSYHSCTRELFLLPQMQPRFRGNVSAVSEIGQCSETFCQVSLYRESGTISFSIRD